MKDKSGKKKDSGKAAASALALLTAASVFTGGLFPTADSLLNGDGSPSAATYVDGGILDDGDGGDGGSDFDEQDTEKSKRASVKALLRQRILRLPLAVRILVVFPLWLLGTGIIALAGAVWMVLAPFAQDILGFLLVLALLFGTFLAAAKAAFPDLPLKKLLNRRTIPVLLVLAAGLSALDKVLALAWADYGRVRQIVVSCAFLLALGSAVTAFCLREQRKRCIAAALPAPAGKGPIVSFTDPSGTFSLKPAARQND